MALGVATTVALYYITGLSMTTMVGVMSGAVTNTPGLGAAQQAFSDMHAGADAPDIATGTPWPTRWASWEPSSR